MADIYIPGLKSRFDTDKIVEGLMAVERIPKTRVEKEVETLQTQKSYWQEVGRKISSLREASRTLFSFQNPFTERSAVSGNPQALSAAATREAVPGEHYFTVKETAAADRFLSDPLPSGYNVPQGRYTFVMGKDKVSFDYRGGTVGDFTETLNRRGADKIGAMLVNVEKNKKALLLESKLTGTASRLSFADGALKFASDTGLIAFESEEEKAAGIAQSEAAAKLAATLAQDEEAARLAAAAPPEPVIIHIKPVSANPNQAGESNLVVEQSQGAASNAAPMSEVNIDFPEKIMPGPTMLLRYETWMSPKQTDVKTVNPMMLDDRPAPFDTNDVLSLVLDDGSTVPLPELSSADDNFAPQSVAIADIAGGHAATGIKILNSNTSREVALRNIQLFDPTPQPMAAQPSVAPTPPAASAPAVAKADDDIAYRDGWRPKNAVSTARDAVLTMDGIEITRPTNIVDDLLPGVTLEAKEQTATPVRLAVETNREAVKDSLINFVANYNKALVDINTLTRSDDKVVSELDWLSAEELEGLRKKLGAFSGDSSLSQMRSAIVNAASSPYALPGGRTMVLSELGIGTDMARRGGYDPSKLRGYLEIDEKILDSALLGSLDEVKAFFGSDTDGDLIVDSGLAFTMDRYMRPYVETGGIITNKTVTIDSRIARDESRMENLDRQLASKEQSLKNQYGQMEGAYNRMDRMSSSLDSLNNQDSRR